MADDDIITTVTGDTISRSDIVESNILFYKEAYEKSLTDVTDFSEGSEIRTLHESIAVDVINLYRELHRLHKMKFINYSEGYYLDELGCEQHLQRKGSQIAHGQVTFTIPEIISTDIVIPQGTVIIQRTTGYEYILQENCVIAQGTVSTSGDVYSKITGARYNATANTLTGFQDIESIRNIISVTNPEAITGGVDAETDEEFRERIRNVKQEKAYGTIPTYNNLILNEVTDVHDVAFINPEIIAKSTHTPHYRPGTTTVCTECSRIIYVNANSKPCPTSVIDEVSYVMSQQNNLVIGHKFHIEKVSIVPLYFSIHIYYDYPIDEDLLVNHIEAFMNGDEITTKSGTVRYSGLNIGSPLYKSQLIDAIEDVPGVHHVESIHQLKYNDTVETEALGKWTNNGSTQTYVDEDNYIYQKDSSGSVDYWGEKNFDSILCDDGEVFSIGAKSDIDSTCDTIFEFTQTSAQ